MVIGSKTSFGNNTHISLGKRGDEVQQLSIVLLSLYATTTPFEQKRADRCCSDVKPTTICIKCNNSIFSTV
jgi:hypothetical protein